MLDDFVVDDMVVYLEANFCLPTMQNCDRVSKISFDYCSNQKEKYSFYLIPYSGACYEGDVFNLPVSPLS